MYCRSRNPEFFYTLPFDGNVDVKFLPKLLQSPKLTSLSITATSITNSATKDEWNQLKGRSNLESLYIRAGTFSIKTLRRILGALPDLEWLSITATRFEDTYYGVRELNYSRSRQSYNYGFPAMSKIGAAIRAFCPKLEDLYLGRGDGGWRAEMDLVGSLSSLESLRSLSLPASMLLGWNHCFHHASHDRPTDSDELPSLLPSSLKHLALRLDDFHHSRNGEGYVESIARVLTAKHDLFPVLSTFDIESSFRSYCMECEHDRRDDSSSWCRAAISVQEVSRTIEILESGEITFRFRTYTSDGECFLDEFDADKMHRAPEGLITCW